MIVVSRYRDRVESPVPVSTRFGFTVPLNVTGGRSTVEPALPLWRISCNHNRASSPAWASANFAVNRHNRTGSQVEPSRWVSTCHNRRVE